MFSAKFRLDRDCVEPVSRTPEHLLGLRSSVSIDGEGTTFDVAVTNQRPFRLLIPFTVMPAIFSEIRQAQTLMVHRQRMRDGGNAKLLELCDAALRPRHLDVLCDPGTGDRLFVHQFDEHPPLVFRVTLPELAHNLRLAVRSFRQSYH